MVCLSHFQTSVQHLQAIGNLARFKFLFRPCGGILDEFNKWVRRRVDRPFFAYNVQVVRRALKVIFDFKNIRSINAQPLTYNPRLVRTSRKPAGQDAIDCFTQRRVAHRSK